MKHFAMLKFAFVLFAIAIRANAQWNPNTNLNTPVCLSNGRQIDLRMIEDGKGGTFITWKDYRPSNGLPDIYVQRMDSAGYPKWMGNGVVICNESHDQSTPAIVTDMRGGAIIAWSDWRSSIERDLYAQRVDSTGVVKWTVNGANVSNLSNREHSEKIVSDGKGGVIIVFEKQISGIWDIWAQRLDSSGNKLWGAGGVALTTVAGNRRNHKVQKDRSGGAIVTWQDLRNGTNYDIYAQRLDANGNLLWGAAAKPVCVAAGDQINAKIEADSLTNGAYLAWQDTRVSTDYDIYMQHIDSMGNPKWTLDGIVIANQLQNQSALDMLSSAGGDQVIITWKDKRSGNYDIYAQKVNRQGVLQWTSTGVVLCNLPYDQINPNICTDESNGAIVVWQDSSQSRWDVRAQRVNSAGQVLWGTNGEVVSNAVYEQTSPKNVSDGWGGSIFAWQDTRNGLEDIYVHHIHHKALALPEWNVTNHLDVFPNPGRDRIWINLGQAEKTTSVLLGNMLGVSYPISFTQTGSRLQADVQALPPGLYTVQVKTPSGVYSSRWLRAD